MADKKTLATNKNKKILKTIDDNLKKNNNLLAQIDKYSKILNGMKDPKQIPKLKLLSDIARIEQDKEKRKLQTDVVKGQCIYSEQAVKYHDNIVMIVNTLFVTLKKEINNNLTNHIRDKKMLDECKIENNKIINQNYKDIADELKKLLSETFNI